MADRGGGLISLTPFDDEQGARMLLHYIKRDEPYEEEDMNIACEISSLVGGLPVVMLNISFMQF